MDLGISGRKALVCGASAGLGFACAQALAREGVELVIVARTEGPLREAAEKLKSTGGAPVSYVAADVTTAEGRAKIFSNHGGFDIVVTNAGGPPPGDFRDWDRDTWLRALDANMLTPIELIQATVDGMAERGFGRIVNITSAAVKAPIDILGLSNGARSGLTGFIAGLARQPKIAAKGVTINNLLPGPFETERLRVTFEGSAAKTGRPIEQLMDERRATVPARRFGDPREFGEVCAFLCSRQAAYLNGQNILLDGGAYPGTF